RYRSRRNLQCSLNPMRTNPESGFFNPRVFLAFLLCFAGVLLALIGFGQTSPRSAAPPAFAPVVTNSIVNGLSPAISDLPSGPPSSRKIEEENGLLRVRPDRAVPPNFVDPVVQSAPVPLAMATPLATFEGQNANEGCNGCITPD